MDSSQTLGFALAAAAVLVAGLAVGRYQALTAPPRHPADPMPDGAQAAVRTAVWVTTVCLGAILTVAMTFLTVTLTLKLHTGLTPEHATNPPTIAASGSQAAVGSALAPASGNLLDPHPPSAGEGDAKDAVSNAMTAVSLVAAVVALLLTIGAAWLGKQQKALDEAISKVESQVQQFGAWQEYEGQRAIVQSLLPAAVMDVTRWVIDQKPRGGKPPRPSEFATVLFFDRTASLITALLELASDDRDMRGRSFDLLAQHFSEPEDKASLGGVQAYCEACHQLAVQRAWTKREVKSPKQVNILEERGLWCRVFSTKEIRRRTSLRPGA